MILLALAFFLPPLDEIEARASLNDGARVTNSSTVQLRVRILSPLFPGLEMSVSDGPWQPYKESQPVELPAGDGEKKVVVKLRDSTGAIRGAVGASIVVDTTPPEAKVKVRAENGTSGDMVMLQSDVPDAVAMQWTEDATRWGPWMPYLNPRAVHLSPGRGPKTLLVRYRDEAGNIGKPATLQTESVDSFPDIDFDHVEVSAVPGPGDRLMVTLKYGFGEMEKMSLQVDQDPALPQEPYKLTRILGLPRTGGAHRIRLVLYSSRGSRVYPMEVAFLESDVLQKSPAEAAHETPAMVPTLWSLSVQGGVLPSAIDFEAMTPTGNRKINKDSLGFARLSMSYEFLDPIYGQVGLEYAGGGGIRVYSGTIDVGARLFRTGPLDVSAEAGLMYSELRITENAFGDFKEGLGFRGGVRASFHLAPQVALDATIDYRRISYDYSESLLSGDTQARLSTVGLLLGVSLKF